jgi:hypothetical protein
MQGYLGNSSPNFISTQSDRNTVLQGDFVAYSVGYDNIREHDKNGQADILVHPSNNCRNVNYHIIRKYIKLDDLEDTPLFLDIKGKALKPKNYNRPKIMKEMCKEMDLQQLKIICTVGSSDFGTMQYFM